MKKPKTFLLTLLLSIGFFFPSCDKDDPGDSCDGVVFLNHFDVKGLAVLNYSDLANQNIITPSDTIDFDELDKVYIDYVVEYIVRKPAPRDWSFSLMQNATACSYIAGGSGSREEQLVSLSITTINDFDNDHLANSNINDLFEYHGSYGSYWERLTNPIPFTQFIDEQTTENLQAEDIVLALNKAPEIDQTFQIKVEMELSTGEVYEFETFPIVILP